MGKSGSKISNPTSDDGLSQEETDELLETTKYKVEEINNWYTTFKQDNPHGKMDREVKSEKNFDNFIKDFQNFYENYSSLYL